MPRYHLARLAAMRATQATQGEMGHLGSQHVLLLPTGVVVNVHHHSSVVAVDALLVGVRVSSTWRMGTMAPEVHIWVLLSVPISQTGQGQKK